MKKYYINTDERLKGFHEVHDESCIYLPGLKNKKYFGNFPSCKEAVLLAKKFYSTADGCKTCSPECHTS